MKIYIVEHSVNAENSLESIHDIVGAFSLVGDAWKMIVEIAEAIALGKSNYLKGVDWTRVPVGNEDRISYVWKSEDGTTYCTHLKVKETTLDEL